MQLQKFIIPFVLSTFGLGFSTQSVEAFTLNHLSSDSEMNALMQDIAFVAEGRIGDRSGSSTHELNLHESDPGHPQATDQFNWLSGVAQPFELLYDAVSHLVHFTVGDRTLTQSYSNPFSDFFLRTRATQAGSSMLLSNLQLDGVFLNAQSHAIADTGGLDILQISDVMGSFKLTGESTMTWQGTPPIQSQLAFQIKVAQATPPKEVPEPNLAISLLILSLMGITSQRPS